MQIQDLWTIERIRVGFPPTLHSTGNRGSAGDFFRFVLRVFLELGIGVGVSQSAPCTKKKGYPQKKSTGGFCYPSTN